MKEKKERREKGDEIDNKQIFTSKIEEYKKNEFIIIFV